VHRDARSVATGSDHGLGLDVFQDAARGFLSETDSTVRVMRLVVARYDVTYTGRLSTVLPEATRLLMFKEDGSFLVRDDAGGYKPLNWMRTDFRLSPS
jgi:RecB family endonuclease NucS